jgi:hypothetical protein
VTFDYIRRYLPPLKELFQGKPHLLRLLTREPRERKTWKTKDYRELLRIFKPFDVIFQKPLPQLVDASVLE